MLIFMKPVSVKSYLFYTCSSFHVLQKSTYIYLYYNTVRHQSIIIIIISNLSNDRPKTSSKTIPPHSAIQDFLLQLTVSSPVLKAIQQLLTPSSSSSFHFYLPLYLSFNNLLQKAVSTLVYNKQFFIQYARFEHKRKSHQNIVFKVLKSNFTSRSSNLSRAALWPPLAQIQ